MNEAFDRYGGIYYFSEGLNLLFFFFIFNRRFEKRLLRLAFGLRPAADNMTDSCRCFKSK